MISDSVYMLKDDERDFQRPNWAIKTILESNICVEC